MSKEAAEYLRELKIIKPGNNEFWIHWPDRDSVELSKIMQAYADKVKLENTIEALTQHAASMENEFDKGMLLETAEIYQKQLKTK